MKSAFFNFKRGACVREAQGAISTLHYWCHKSSVKHFCFTGRDQLGRCTGTHSASIGQPRQSQQTASTESTEQGWGAERWERGEVPGRREGKGAGQRGQDWTYVGPCLCFKSSREQRITLPPFCPSATATSVTCPDAVRHTSIFQRKS